jgi:hypothetical protein
MYLLLAADHHAKRAAGEAIPAGSGSSGTH